MTSHNVLLLAQLALDYVALNESPNAVFIWSAAMCFIFCRANKPHIYVTPLRSKYSVWLHYKLLDIIILNKENQHDFFFLFFSKFILNFVNVARINYLFYLCLCLFFVCLQVYIQVDNILQSLWICETFTHYLDMSHIMRKPVFAICKQQRRRSACASAQSDQRLCCSLPG